MRLDLADTTELTQTLDFTAGWLASDSGAAASSRVSPTQAWRRLGTPAPRGGSVAGMLLAEDLLLLVTDDTSGRLSAPAAQVDAGLGGANLVELTLVNKVDLSGEGDQGKPGRIIVRDPAPAGDEVLDAALEILITRQGSKPSAVIRPLSKNLRHRLYQRVGAERDDPRRAGQDPGHLPRSHLAGSRCPP
jgi:hypothetical protein